VNASDDFAGLAAAADLSTRSPWAARTGSIVGEASGGRVRSGTGSQNAVYAYDSGTWGNDQRVGCFVFWSDLSNSAVGPAVRVSADGDAYAFIVNEAGQGFLNKYIDGFYDSTPYSTSSGAIASGSFVELDISGTTLRVYDDGADISGAVVDATHATGKPGLGGYNDSATIYADGWTADDGVSSAPVLSAPTVTGITTTGATPRVTITI
jgi:hypothetical protein